MKWNIFLIKKKRRFTGICRGRGGGASRITSGACSGGGGGWIRTKSGGGAGAWGGRTYHKMKTFVCV